MPADGLDFMETVRGQGGGLVLRANQRPELPAVEVVALPQVEKWIDVIVGHHILYARLGVKRKKDEFDFVPEEPVLEMAVKWKHGGVVEAGVGGALLKVKGKQRKAVKVRPRLGLPAGDAQ